MFGNHIYRYMTEGSSMSALLSFSMLIVCYYNVTVRFTCGATMGIKER